MKGLQNRQFPSIHGGRLIDWSQDVFSSKSYQIVLSVTVD